MYIFVTSDGEGFQIIKSSNDSGSKPVVGNLISFAIDYHLSEFKIRNANVIYDFNIIIQFINAMYDDYDEMCSELIKHLNFNTYYYVPHQLNVANGAVNSVLDIAFKVIIQYPFEFAQYLTKLAKSPYSTYSTYGVSIYFFDQHNNGFGNHLIGGNSKLKLTNGSTEIELIPKVLHSSVDEVIPNINEINFTHFLNTIKSVSTELRARIKAMRQNVKSVGDAEYQRGYNAGIAVLSSCPEGWTVGNIPGVLETCFIYRNVIHPKYIRRSSGTIYTIPEDLREVFFIKDIAVPIGSTLTNVKARGMFPHISSNKSYGTKIDNYNDDDWYMLCIGDLANKPFSQINDIIPMLETINYSSMFPGTMSDIVGKLIGSEKFIVDETGIYNAKPDGSKGSKVGKDAIWNVIFKYAGRLAEGIESDDTWRV